jgi:hypothetical protein
MYNNTRGQALTMIRLYSRSRWPQPGLAPMSPPRPRSRVQPHARARLDRMAEHILHSAGRLPGPSRAAGLEAAAAAESTKPRAIDVGILTEATGDHLGGFLNGFATCPGVRCVSVADISDGAQFDAVRTALPADRMGGVYTDVAAMLSARKPTLTLVTAEPHRTPGLVRAALESGSHVIVEKPGCYLLAEFEEVCELAESLGLEIMLAMATRVSPAVKKVKELIGKGFLGKPYSATMDWVADQTRLIHRSA